MNDNPVMKKFNIYSDYRSLKLIKNLAYRFRPDFHLLKIKHYRDGFIAERDRVICIQNLGECVFGRVFFV